MPLEGGLRALADEIPSARLARVLRQLADRLTAGATLEAAIRALGSRLPADLRGLIVAGIRSGRLAVVLEEFAALIRRQQQLRRRATLAVAYPTLLLGDAVAPDGLHLWLSRPGVPLDLSRFRNEVAGYDAVVVYRVWAVGRRHGGRHGPPGCPPGAHFPGAPQRLVVVVFYPGAGPWADLAIRFRKCQRFF